MSFINRLKEILDKGSYLEPKLNENGRNNLKLTESSANNSYEITIRNVPGESIAIKLDENFPEPNSLLSNKKGQRKRCDYAIVSVKKGRLQIIFLELKNNGSNKSSSFSKETLQQQLTGGISCIEYIRSIAENFWNEREIFKKYKSYFVAMVKVTGKKRPTKNTVTSNKKHTKPGNFLKLTHYDSIEFNQIGGSSR